MDDRNALPARLTKAAGLALVVLVTACGGHPEQQVRGQSGQAQRQPEQARPPAVAGPPPVSQCAAPEPDSTTAVSMAFAALQTPELPLRVSSFVRHHEGVLVSLLPQRRDVTGGGGLVWVDRDGCLMVLKRYE